MNVTEDGSDMHMSWDPPTGDFTRVMLYQCHDPDDEYDECVSHDVTDISSLTVSRSDGERLKLVVWQDRDDVLVHRVPMSPDSNSGTTSDDVLVHRITINPDDSSYESMSCPISHYLQ